jgi:hypothetical protein
MRKLFAIMLLFVTCHAMPGKNNKDLPHSPLPGAIRDAKKVLLTTGGAGDLAIDAFYSAMQSWGKYEIVGSPDDADLIVELTFRVRCDRNWLHDETVGAPRDGRRYSLLMLTTLTVFDAKSNRSLWSAVEGGKLALTQKNREKDAMNLAQELVEELKIRVKASE